MESNTYNTSDAPTVMINSDAMKSIKQLRDSLESWASFEESCGLKMIRFEHSGSKWKYRVIDEVKFRTARLRYGI